MTITPAELKARLDKGDEIRLIDVREADEWAIAKLPQAELIPLSQFQQFAVQKLDRGRDDHPLLPSRDTLAKAQGFLKAQGYGNVINLTGGIDAWSLYIDPTVKRY